MIDLARRTRRYLIPWMLALAGLEPAGAAVYPHALDMAESYPAPALGWRPPDDSLIIPAVYRVLGTQPMQADIAHLNNDPLAVAHRSDGGPRLNQLRLSLGTALELRSTSSWMRLDAGRWQELALDYAPGPWRLAGGLGWGGADTERARWWTVSGGVGGPTSGLELSYRQRLAGPEPAAQPDGEDMVLLRGYWRF